MSPASATLRGVLWASGGEAKGRCAAACTQPHGQSADDGVVATGSQICSSGRLSSCCESRA